MLLFFCLYFSLLLQDTHVFELSIDEDLDTLDNDFYFFDFERTLCLTLTFTFFIIPDTK